VGCIYTAQGFEFDYIGVIIGNDLYVDRTSGKLSTNIAATKDPMLKRSIDNFEKACKEYLQDTSYQGNERVLCLFTDKRTEDISGRGWRNKHNISAK